MFFVEAPEQAHLGCDDQAGVRNLYQGVFGGGRGQISGRIALETSGQSVSGAEVFALSLANGTLSHSSITVQDGRFEIGQLDPGNYAIWIAPYLPGASALPPYYSGIQPKVCPGGVAFSRDLDATIRNVRSGSSVDVGTLNVRCGGPAPVRASTSLDASPGSFAIHDRMDSSSRDYRVSIPGGDLKVHALGYSLFSPVALSVSVLDSRGTSVSGARLSPVYTSSRSGFSNYDGATWVKDLPAGEYIIRVSRQFLGSQYYPGGMIALDSVPFIALVGEVLPARAATTEMSDQIQMSQSSRCVMNESFAAYQSPGGLPPRSQITEESRDESKGFCGSIRASGGAVPPQTGLQIMAWLLPWGFCLALTRLLLVKRALQA
jgi:hypothetical protein